MPVSAVVEDKIICMHGGLSPELEQLSQITELPRPTEIPEDGLLCDLLWSDPDPSILGWGYNSRGVSYTFGLDVIREFLERHDLDLVCRAHQVVEDGYEFFAKRQVRPSHPQPLVTQSARALAPASLQPCFFSPSRRPACRWHRRPRTSPARPLATVPTSRPSPHVAARQLVTVFSAPNYCGEFDNCGAMMSVDENLMCSFQVLKPVDSSGQRWGSGRPGTPPRKPKQ